MVKTAIFSCGWPETVIKRLTTTKTGGGAELGNCNYFLFFSQAFKQFIFKAYNKSCLLKIVQLKTIEQQTFPVEKDDKFLN